jgi:hypothetical protein
VIGEYHRAIGSQLNDHDGAAVQSVHVTATMILRVDSKANAACMDCDHDTIIT